MCHLAWICHSYELFVLCSVLNSLEDVLFDQNCISKRAVIEQMRASRYPRYGLLDRIPFAANASMGRCAAAEPPRSRPAAAPQPPPPLPPPPPPPPPPPAAARRRQHAFSRCAADSTLPMHPATCRAPAAQLRCRAIAPPRRSALAARPVEYEAGVSGNQKCGHQQTSIWTSSSTNGTTARSHC